MCRFNKLNSLFEIHFPSENHLLSYKITKEVAILKSFDLRIIKICFHRKKANFIKLCIWDRKYGLCFITTFLWKGCSFSNPNSKPHLEEVHYENFTRLKTNVYFSPTYYYRKNDYDMILLCWLFYFSVCICHISLIFQEGWVFTSRCLRDCFV